MTEVLPVLTGRPKPDALARYGDGPDVVVDVYDAADGNGYAFVVRGPSALLGGASLMGPSGGAALYATATEALAAGLDLPDDDGEAHGAGRDAGEFPDESIFFPE